MDEDAQSRWIKRHWITDVAKLAALYCLNVGRDGERDWLGWI
jgi:hypothetical protein